MVTQETGDNRDVTSPRYQRIVSREVIGPEERLLPQLDGRGEEEEKGQQHGHLDKHGNTAAHGTDAHLAVKVHGSLLPLHHHILIIAWVLLLQLLYLGSKHPHLSGRHKRLVGNGQGDQLHTKGQD